MKRYWMGDLISAPIQPMGVSKMLFRAIIKRDGTREVHAIEDWPDEDQIAQQNLQNEDMYYLEDGDLRITVTNGMALYKVVREDADWLWIRKISSSIDRT